MVRKGSLYLAFCLMFTLAALGEEFLLSADEAARILSAVPPWPTNSAIIALSGSDKLPQEALTGWQPGDSEFAQALSFTQLKKDRQAELVEVYRRAENTFLEFTRARDDYNYRRYWARYGLYDQPEKPVLELMEFPPDMPEEFRFFLEGLQHYYRGDPESARELWDRVRELPANKKIYCENWARTLYADSYSESDPYRTIRDLEEIRKDLQKRSHLDPRLTACLLRCEASSYAAVTNYPQAMNRYFALNLLGFRREEMIHYIANLIMKSEGADLEIAAKNQAVAKMTTWHAATLYSNLRLGTLDIVDKEAIARWLRALKKEGRLEDVADFAAVAAYRIGDKELVEEAIKSARYMSPFAGWIMAKKKLSDGKRAEAESDLATLFFSFPNMAPELRNAIGRDLSFLYLSDQRYKEALKLSLLIDDWQEAAYIAEQVMTIKELEHYVKERELETIKDDQNGPRLKYLLARRLAREGDLKDAGPYFPRLAKANADQIMASLAIGRNTDLPAPERGSAIGDAARGIYYGGEPLFATESAPDWFSSEGREPRAYFQRYREQSSLAPVSEDEERRVKLHAKRIPARQLCLDNAVSQVWLAVELMPDNSDSLAELLSEAGHWTENRDLETSRKFYETLIRRCPSTALGQEAQNLRWFPQAE
jgi:hypothetical protein